MLIPVKCFTCGKVIGDKYLYYQSEVIKKRKEQGIHPDKIHYLDDDKVYIINKDKSKGELFGNYIEDKVIELLDKTDEEETNQNKTKFK